MKLLTLSGWALAALTLPIMANAAAPGQSVLAVVQAQGAQVYECKAHATGNLAWQFREPIATLIQDGKTVGRHYYAGPNWEFADGSAVVGKVVERTAGATPTDIPSLKLEATSHRGAGVLANVMSIERLNTHGGMAEGPCPAAGADYVFYGIAHDNRQKTLEPSREPPVAGPAKVRLSLVSSAVK